MRTKFIAFCLVAACATSARAQDALAANVESPAEHGPDKCLMKSNASTWQAIGLTADETTKAQAIADRCTKDHAAKATPEDKGKMEGESSYVTDLKNALTPAEFTNWQDWCSKQALPKDASKAGGTKTY